MRAIYHDPTARLHGGFHHLRIAFSVSLMT
ncbi:hypothetical protein BRAS3809_5420013 [Bradyrhizobium sp. STM 3809]|nr:hypothetical protein BRAS3809_5420013 [Bradyrhizobium sp. STM 3809]